jgi:hypothetical protein
VQVVDKRAATLGLPGTREKQIAVDADHSHICKFPRGDDDSYEQVADNIVELIENAIQAVVVRERPTQLRALHHDQNMERPNGT